jgi:hypothetical protein
MGHQKISIAFDKFMKNQLLGKTSTHSKKSIDESGLQPLGRMWREWRKSIANVPEV